MGAGTRKTSESKSCGRKASARRGPEATSSSTRGNGRLGRGKRNLDDDARLAELRSLYQAVASEPIPPRILALLKPPRDAG
jgi:hypothetical protein